MKITLESFIAEELNKLSKKDIIIINDILSNNESLGDWWNKFINYGKRGLLTAAILLSVAFSSQAQQTGKSQDVIKQGTQMMKSNEKKDVYSFFVGISTENISLAMKQGDIDAAGAFKEISKHYQALRDDKTPEKISSDSSKYMKVIENVYKTLSENDIAHFIEEGKTIKTLF